MQSYNQEDIIVELRRRIVAGQYTKLLPTAAQLAEEFQVNVKTMNKALNRLAATGLVERRRRLGTMVRQNQGELSGNHRLIEVVFSGFTAPFQHPFWSEILEGIHEVFSAADYRIILNHIITDRRTHLFNREQIELSDAAARIVVGPGEKWVLDWIAATKRPMICVGDEISAPDTPQVYLDFSRGISDAIDYLAKERQCRKIGFIGHTGTFINPGVLQKFHAYLYATQRYTQMDFALLENCWPTLGTGREALLNILKRERPDALLVAFDLLIPEIYETLAEHNISIPLVGCDGLKLETTPPDYRTVSAPRRQCGRLGAKLLLKILDGKPIGKNQRHALMAEFQQD